MNQLTLKESLRNTSFSYRQSILANKTRQAILRLDGDAKQARFHNRKRTLYLRQRGKCCFCERKTFLDSAHTTKSFMATIEHVIPKSKGGSDGLHNLKISCYKCNSDRKTIDFDTFLYMTKHGVSLRKAKTREENIEIELGRAAKRRAQRTYRMMMDAYHVLDGGPDIPNGINCKIHKNRGKKFRQNYWDEFSFISAMNEMDVSRAMRA